MLFGGGHEFVGFAEESFLPSERGSCQIDGGAGLRWGKERNGDSLSVQDVLQEPHMVDHRDDKDHCQDEVASHGALRGSQQVVHLGAGALQALPDDSTFKIGDC